MEEKKLTCICCPMGCQLQVTIRDGQVEKVEGNTCKRGAEYGKKEVTNPTRIVTSSVIVEDGTLTRASVKTEKDIPKGKIFDIMKEIRAVRMKAPVHMGDVIIRDCAGTGVSIIATKTVEAV